MAWLGRHDSLVSRQSILGRLQVPRQSPTKGFSNLYPSDFVLSPWCGVFPCSVWFIFLTGDFVAQGPLNSAGGYNRIFSLTSKI
jgi:hypothetical protein